MYDQPFIEVKVSVTMYVYTRGKVLIALTNQKNYVSGMIKKHPFKQGDKICNLFDKDDCIVVGNKDIRIHLMDGKSKIYVNDYLADQIDNYSAVKFITLLIVMASFVTTAKGYNGAQGETEIEDKYKQ